MNRKAILCVFGNRSHRCLNRWTLHKSRKGVAHLGKSEGVAPLRELLDILHILCLEEENILCSGHQPCFFNTHLVTKSWVARWPDTIEDDKRQKNWLKPTSVCYWRECTDYTKSMRENTLIGIADTAQWWSMSMAMFIGVFARNSSSCRFTGGGQAGIDWVMVGWRGSVKQALVTDCMENIDWMGRKWMGGSGRHSPQDPLTLQIFLSK